MRPPAGGGRAGRGGGASRDRTGECVNVEAYTWRPVTAAGLPALTALDAACRVVDGPASVPDPTYAVLLTAPNTTLLCAERGDDPNHLAAVGWVQVNEGQARLGGKVHPDHRRKGL